jgi:outer membrane protein OmpA-like peptidoglycan-associated protein
VGDTHADVLARESVMKNTTFIMLALFLITCPVSAGEYNFETTAEGIEKALTQPRPTKKIRTRGIKTRGIQSAKTRGIKVVEKEQGKVVEKTIIVDENHTPQGVNLKIEFDVDSYHIRPESFALLDELGKALTGDTLKELKIFIKGHTDTDGSDPYNLRLSLDRGLSVKQYLTANFAIPPTRLKVIGYGESMPLVPNTSTANKQLNRRVEIGTNRTQ